MSEHEPSLSVDQFWKDGFSHIRGLFSPDVIRSLRQTIVSKGIKSFRGDLLTYPELRDLVFDNRLLNLVRQVLDSDKLVYCGDSNVTAGSRGFHKDNVDRDDPNGPDWTTGRYTVVRVGIYLQDHSVNSGGLNVIRGSHERVDTSGLENVYLRTRVGDAAIWSLRTTHSGSGYMHRFNPGLAIPPDWLDSRESQIPKRKIVKRYLARGQRLIRKLQIRPASEGRVACFMSFGVGDHHQQRFIDCLKSRQYAIDLWNASEYDDDVLRRAKEVGLEVLDMKKENAANPAPEIYKVHTPIPYPKQNAA